jgi:cytochrome c-type biogenesis protein CcmF
MHYFIGNLGHLFTVVSFTAALLAAFSYFKAVRSSGIDHQQHWLANGRFLFAVHTLAVLCTVICLFVIIYNHYFEYYYAYTYSDRRLPAHYLFSTFWNGQEGSFLLWIFWHTVLGLILMATNRFWEAPVLMVFALVQAFLTSMILGVVIPGLELKIGSSPFILLRDALNDPIFTLQPDFIPADGQGLNPLLQNYWMVIHPPVLFLGFASTLVPFSFCLAGLWTRKYRDWIRPALPWALFAGASLGLGILLGGYWAYETLNFGGYWNWDPVENAVYVPWLVLIASIHTMIAYKNSQTALKASIVLTLAVFVLILYATFLTRSGVLGDASVHSFTDLGLSAQLLIYLFFFLLAAFALAAWRWKEIPTDTKEASVYSREFWIFTGATVLCLMGFQVLLPTSFPVINKVAGWLGLSSNLATPADQVSFYSRFQLWFAVVLALLSGIGQYFWWNKIDRRQLMHNLYYPGLAALVLFTLLVSITKIHHPAYLILSLAALFTITTNGKILWHVLKSSPSLSGGAVAHIGVGLMLLGIMFSSGYSRVVSLNNTGMLISRQLSEEFNRENLLLFVNEPREMYGYEIEYRGERVEPRHKSGYISKRDIEYTANPYQVIAKRDIYYNQKKLFSRGEKFEINPENTFYEIVFRKNGEVKFVQYPRVQVNPQFGNMASPDITRKVGLDLYTHVSAPMTEEAKQDWSAREELRIKRNATFFANDYVAQLVSLQRADSLGGEKLDSTFLAVKARITVSGKDEQYMAEPVLIIGTQRRGGLLADEIPELGLRFTLMNIHPQTDEVTIGVETRQKDWVVIKALEKPLINILWLGTGLLMVGFGVAIARRFREFRLMRQKGLE